MSAQMPLLDVDPAARREHDFYETPSWMTDALVDRLRLSGRVLECCAGLGAIALAMPYTVEVITNEPYQQLAADYRLDATRPESWAQFPAVEWVISNPPFNLASAIVPLALEHAKVGVAMVLRLSWFEPTEDRDTFLEAHPPTAIIAMPRHNFRGTASTDSVTSAWFVWAKDGGIDNGVVTKGERDVWIRRRTPMHERMRG